MGRMETPADKKAVLRALFEVEHRSVVKRPFDLDMEKLLVDQGLAKPKGIRGYLTLTPEGKAKLKEGWDGYNHEAAWWYGFHSRELAKNPGDMPGDSWRFRIMDMNVLAMTAADTLHYSNQVDIRELVAEAQNLSGLMGEDARREAQEDEEPELEAASEPEPPSLSDPNAILNVIRTDVRTSAPLRQWLNEYAVDVPWQAAYIERALAGNDLPGALVDPYPRYLAAVNAQRLVDASLWALVHESGETKGIDPYLLERYARATFGMHMVSFAARSMVQIGESSDRGGGENVIGRAVVGSPHFDQPWRTGWWGTDATPYPFDTEEDRQFELTLGAVEREKDLDAFMRREAPADSADASAVKEGYGDMTWKAKVTVKIGMLESSGHGFGKTRKDALRRAAVGQNLWIGIRQAHLSQNKITAVAVVEKAMELRKQYGKEAMAARRQAWKLVNEHLKDPLMAEAYMAIHGHSLMQDVAQARGQTSAYYLASVALIPDLPPYRQHTHQALEAAANSRGDQAVEFANALSLAARGAPVTVKPGNAYFVRGETLQHVEITPGLGGRAFRFYGHYPLHAARHDYALRWAVWKLCLSMYDADLPAKLRLKAKSGGPA